MQILLSFHSELYRSSVIHDETVFGIQTSLEKCQGSWSCYSCSCFHSADVRRDIWKPSSLLEAYLHLHSVQKVSKTHVTKINCRTQANADAAICYTSRHIYIPFLLISKIRIILPTRPRNIPRTPERWTEIRHVTQPTECASRTACANKKKKKKGSRVDEVEKYKSALGEELGRNQMKNPFLRRRVKQVGIRWVVIAPWVSKHRYAFVQEKENRGKYAPSSSSISTRGATISVSSKDFDIVLVYTGLYRYEVYNCCTRDPDMGHMAVICKLDCILPRLK